ncbi:hypothetical protein Q5P01_021757 [Channa striata]|uniref:Uncharacterized protein n=1 Tax=Channa striata TaxID=64152 RepID=A0AA88LUQ2_CHASR|nr:hypothetical protein Q5P01_021757 [Channa striata]
MPPLLIWIFGYCLITHGCAQTISCNVTQEADQTCYSVPLYMGTDCQYSWSNKTGHVLANQEGKMENLVLNGSIHVLKTNKCLREIHYIRDCISEGIPREVKCSTNCSGNGSPYQGDNPNYYWIIIIAVLLMLVGIVIYIVRKFHCYRTVARDEEQQ